MAIKDFDELLDNQNKLQSMVGKEREFEETIDILSIISEMAPYPDQRIQKEALFIEAENRGFSHSLVGRIIDKLIRDRILFEPQPGFIQRK